MKALRYLMRIFVIIIIAILISCISQKPNSIIGVWKGKYQNSDIIMQFKSDNSCELEVFNMDLNKIQKITGKYIIDYSKKPYMLSVKNIPELTYSLYSIVDFIDNNTMQITYFSPKWRLRPVTFEKDKFLILKRKN